MFRQIERRRGVGVWGRIVRAMKPRCDLNGREGSEQFEIGAVEWREYSVTRAPAFAYRR